MKEVEVKILDINRTEVEKKLISLGAVRIFDDDIFDTFFDTDDRKLNNERSVLRLRKEGTKVLITFKTKIQSPDNLKVRDETEIEVSDLDKARKIIEGLGYFETSRLQKRRISYKLDGVRFEFDKMHGVNEFVPEFLEIEAADNDTIYKYIGLIGFSITDCKPWNGMKVFRYYQKKFNSD